MYTSPSIERRPVRGPVTLFIARKVARDDVCICALEYADAIRRGDPPAARRRLRSRLLEAVDTFDYLEIGRTIAND